MATKKTTTAPAAPAVMAENPEVALVRKEGASILEFIAKLGSFLVKARELETRANETLAAAKALPKPEDEASDAAVKDFVRLARVDLKEVTEHWEVASLFHRFHKRLTAARDRGTKPIDQAVEIATKLHVDYVEAEKRRVLAEADRKRREEEARAAEERKRELEELEAKALALEESSDTLSARELAFVEAYVTNGGRGEQAAQRAGYKDAFKRAAILLQSAKIVDAIKVKQQAEAIRNQAAAVASMPLETREIVVETKADLAGDRGTKSAVVTNEAAFIKAAIEGQHGIPVDCLMVNQVKLNAYARSLGELINRWPGVRLQTKTTII